MFIKNKLSFSLFLSVVMFLSISGCTNNSDIEDEKKQGRSSAVMPSVEIIQARLGSVPLEERMSGLVRAKNQVALYAEISTQIIRVYAQNGDYVRAGDPLVSLRDKQYQDQVHQAEAALQISQADAKRTDAIRSELRIRLERLRKLVDRQLESRQQFEILQAQFKSADASHDQAEARILQAEADLEERREFLRRTVVRAPISGYVGQRNAEVGMRVDLNSPLFVIGNFDEVRVIIAVTDRMVNRIKIGQTAMIGLGQEETKLIKAEISRISPFLEAGSYTAEAEIDISNSDRLLRPGMFVTVDVLYGETEQALLVPESVLYENPDTGILGVYVALSLQSETPIREPDEYDRDNLPPFTQPTPMTFKPVVVLGRGRGVAGISGINLGDWVITVGQNLIRSVNGKTEARARPVSWERIIALQRLQDQDLIRQFMDKQQRLAEDSFPVDGSVEVSTGTGGKTPLQARAGASSGMSRTAIQ